MISMGPRTSEFVSHVDNVARVVTLEHHPNEWYENVLSARLVNQLRAKPRFTLDGGAGVAIAWDSWFLPQHLQSGSGDIAVFIDLHDRRTGTRARGIGFLEAKRRELKNRNYESINWEQLRLLESQVPRSYVMLYDYESCVVPAWPFGARCVVCPTALVLQANSKSREVLQRLSIPLSTLFVNRYFQGYDLHFGGEQHRIIADMFETRGIPFAITCSVEIGDEHEEEGPAPSAPPTPPMPRGDWQRAHAEMTIERPSQPVAVRHWAGNTSTIKSEPAVKLIQKLQR